MKIKSLYISAGQKNTGSLFISIGMMEVLKRNLHKVAFFARLFLAEIFATKISTLF